MDGQVTLDTAGLLSMVIGLLLPVLVGLVTTRVTSGGAKATLLAGLAAISGFVTTWLAAVNSNDLSWRWQDAIFVALLTWGTAVATHFGFLIPTGLKAKAQDALIKAEPGPDGAYDVTTKEGDPPISGGGSTKQGP